MSKMRDRPTCELICGDCLKILPALPAESVHAIVTDPPYGLEFMGKEWDKLARPCAGNLGGFADGNKPSFERVKRHLPAMQDWHRRWATEALRLAKPGAFLLAFGGTRTFHRLTCALEDAGWEIRDCVMWLYGSGFPKSLDVSKAIDKAAGAERERIRGVRSGVVGPTYAQDTWSQEHKDSVLSPESITEAAKQWDGWGTALKPAWEPIIVARKPLDGTVANNVLKHGCGGLNVDGCRVGTIDDCARKPSNLKPGAIGYLRDDEPKLGGVGHEQGRWPANVVHDGSDEVVVGFPVSKDGVAGCRSDGVGMFNMGGHSPWGGYGGAGSAARFFYCAKASRSERNAGCGGLPLRESGIRSETSGQHITRRDGGDPKPTRNNHPTVKPLALMQWLVTLVMPLGGTVLDPFAGSGSTGLACAKLGFNFVGIELDADYATIARRRISGECGLLVEMVEPCEAAIKANV